MKILKEEEKEDPAEIQKKYNSFICIKQTKKKVL